MPTTPRARIVWFRCIMAGGALLALTMLAQTLVGYHYITGSLLLQEGRREATRTVRQLEESMRGVEGKGAPASLQATLDKSWGELSTQAAWIVAVDGQGQVIASRGRTQPTFTGADCQQSLEATEVPMRFEKLGAAPVIVGVFPCRCAGGPPRRPGPAEGATGTAPAPPQRRGPTMVEVALYPGGVSAPFSHVRQQAAINALTACALLGLLIALAFRFRGYLRSRQLEAQLDAARLVQRELMPTADTGIPGVDVATDCTPALHVGGDLVDILPLPRNRTGFILGDVSGKGLSAALLMGVVQGAMSASADELGSETPERAMERVNDLLLRKTSGERYASLFWCSFDPAESTLRYVNAGHPPAVVLRAKDGRVEALKEGGPVLGVIAGAAYVSGCIPIEAGDLLVVFSDGIAEAADARDDEFGAGRIADTIAAADRASSAREVCNAVLTGVEQFADPAGARDDRTLLVVRFTGEGTTAVARARRAA